MYALEKREHGGIWRCCAVCGSREPVAKVLNGLKDDQKWRMVYVPVEIFADVEQADAA